MNYFISDYVISIVDCILFLSPPFLWDPLPPPPPLSLSLSLSFFLSVVFFSHSDQVYISNCLEAIIQLRHPVQHRATQLASVNKRPRIDSLLCGFRLQIGYSRQAQLLLHRDQHDRGLDPGKQIVCHNVQNLCLRGYFPVSLYMTWDIACREGLQLIPDSGLFPFNASIERGFLYLIQCIQAKISKTLDKRSTLIFAANSTEQ